MALRDGTRNIGQHSGKYKRAYYNNDVTRSVPLTVERRQDDVGPGDQRFFQVDRYAWPKSPPTMSGPTLWQSGYYHIYDNYPLVTSTNRHPHSSLFRHGADNGALASQLLKMTNPSRPTVDIPVFIAELKDIPQLFKVVGETAIKTLSKANLAYWFGWKPLASDLLKMCDFSSVVLSRYKELKQLYETGLSCTRRLDIRSAEWSSTEYLNTGSNAVVRVASSATSKTQVWGHCKWKPTTLPPKTDAELIALARRCAFGLTIDPSTVWELIPFSWLVDWFSSVGDYLAASRNIVPSVAYDVSIMRHMECMTNFRVIEQPPLAKVQVNPHFYEQKLREPASASLEAHMPYLSLRQMSILGSLWVLRNERKTRL